MPSALLIQENSATGGVTSITQHLIKGLTAKGWQTELISLKGGTKASRLRAIWGGIWQNPILIATHNFLPSYATWIFATLTRKPWIMWVHGPVIPVLTMAQASPTKQFFLRWIYQRAPIVVSSSQTTQDSFKQFTWPAAQVETFADIPSSSRQLCTIIRNATCIVTTNWAQPSTHEHLEKKPFGSTLGEQIHIGFVGRLSAEKRPLLLLELLNHLPRNFVLHVVGDGPLMDKMKQQGQQHIATQRLHLHGQQTVNAQTYTSWQASVLCSSYEGYPMTPIESLACCVPCVSTPIPAMQEMLSTQAPYMLSSNDTAIALAQALLDTLNMPAARRLHDMKAITESHSAEQFFCAWDALLRLTIASPKARSTSGGHS